MGTNLLYDQEANALWQSGATASKLKDIGMGFMRYPGGEITDNHHWNSLNGWAFYDSWGSNYTQTQRDYNDYMSMPRYLERTIFLPAPTASTKLTAANQVSFPKPERSRSARRAPSPSRRLVP